MALLNMSRAVNKALGDEMEADPTVIVLGEDIAEAGGSFGATRGLLERFGPARVIGTPISEAAIAGAAVGAAVGWALDAAQQLAGQGVDAEVIDLLSLQPWDEAAVLASLAKTHRLVIAHEATEAFGPGAEIAARMADAGFDELDAPIVRVAAPFMPVPFAAALEQAYRPDAHAIVAAVLRTME